MVLCACGATPAPCRISSAEPAELDALVANDERTCLFERTADGLPRMRCWGGWTTEGCVLGALDLRHLGVVSRVDAGGRALCAQTDDGVLCLRASSWELVASGSDVELGPLDRDGVWLREETGARHVGLALARSEDGIGLPPARGRLESHVEPGWLLGAGVAVRPDGSVVSLRSGEEPAGLALGEGVVAISGGLAHGCARMRDGRARCWGFAEPPSEARDLGLSSVTDVVVRGVPWQSDVPGTGVHACALTSDGQVHCLGDSGCDARPVRLELPSNACDPERASAPQRVPLEGAARQIALGAHHACALLTDGSVWCWGSNFYGQLGDGTRADSDVPVRVLGLP